MVKVHLLFLNAAKTETAFDGSKVRPHISFTLEEAGITSEEATKVAASLAERNGIAMWLTGEPEEPSKQAENEQPDDKSSNL
jgi:hypothetical protein